MIKNQLYPYIEKYINDYLYGFTKEQMNLAIIEGKLELNEINLRPDVINKIMDENNVPFWIKAGLINKIYVGCSLMNIIGEIPLEVTIDGINIILSPSYKWINENMNIISSSNEYLKKNPIGIDLNNNNLEIKFDTSIFEKKNMEEIFKDKTIISNIVNSLLKSLYDFYNMTNFAVVFKINKIRIRIEDDELFNYEDNFVLGIKIENITAKMGFKGNMKKNSLKICNFSIYWEKNPKITIKNKFLNDSMKKGELNDEYYNLIKEIEFNSIDDNITNENVKLIIDNFNMSINFGTKKTESTNADIFNIENNSKKCYFQISSNELVINIYPEFLKSINHLSSFSSNFAVIEKIKEYHPYKRPNRNNDQQIQNSRLNDENKNIVRNWMHYFIWRHKMLNKNDVLIENPFRAEFNRFYNIYHKRVNVFDLMEKEKEKKEEKNNNKENNEENKNNNEDNNEEDKENKDIKDNTNNNNDNKESQITGYFEEIYTFEKYISVYGGDINSDKSKEDYQKYLDDILKKKYMNFSSIIEILIKGFIINIHPSLDRNVDINNKIVINTSGIEIKIDISPQQFNFNFGILSIDIGPSDIIYGERVILNPTSYRTNFSQQNIPLDKSMIITPSSNDINSYHEKEKSEAGIGGLIKKFNPNQEEKMKIINDALERVSEEKKGNYDNLNFNNNFNDKINFKKKIVNLKNNNYENSFNNNNTTLRAKPNNLLTSNSSIYDLMNNYSKKGDYTLIRNSGERYSNIKYNVKPRNTSFAKTIIESCNETDLRLKNQLKKQKNELNISQAINNYNTNLSNQRKLTPLNNLRNSSVSNLMSSYSNFKFKSGVKFFHKPNKSNIFTRNSNASNTPLNLIEIYSNSKIGALKIKYIKNNNSFSLDDFSIQLGTIRFHPFPKYISDMLTIFLDYQTPTPEIKRSQIRSIDGGGMEGNKELFKLRQKFLKILNDLDENEKTETIQEYIKYLENEIHKLQIFNDDIETYPFFELNYLFSFFPKGIKFYFDYENIECVYYNNEQKMLGKFMISPFIININISLSKIIVNIFGFNIEINNLMESKILIEKLGEQCKKMINDKKDMIELIIKPCYETIKTELINEGEFDGDILKNSNEFKKTSIKKSINKLPNVNKK